MFPRKEREIEIRASGRWQSMSGSIEPVRRITGRFIQVVRLAAGSDGRSRIPAMIEPSRLIIWAECTSPGHHTLTDPVNSATFSHLQSLSLDEVTLNLGWGGVCDVRRHSV
jgi:hypothetical protein